MNQLYIVDDHSIVRTGLKEWLETNTQWKVVQVFGTGKDCLDFLEHITSEDSKCPASCMPDIIIVDIQLIGETGFSLVKTISKKWPSIKCVMYSMYDTTGYVLQAQDCGAKGYISKVAPETELAKCLEIVVHGGTYLEQKLVDAQIKLDSIVTILTKQEKKILELLLQEKSNDQIATELFISQPTVQNYVSRIYDKAGVSGREELINKFK